MSRFDIIIVGGGVAGLSAGYALSLQRKRVLVLERESQPGIHASGRAVSVYAQSNGYDNPVILALTKTSLSFFLTPPIGFCDFPLVHQCSVIFISPLHKEEKLRVLWQSMHAVLDRVQLLSSPPLEALPLSSQMSREVVYDPYTFDIDSHGLLTGYRRAIKANHGQFLPNSTVATLNYEGGLWTVLTHCNAYQAPIIVNAAGAWSDEIAQLAGIQPLGLLPLRRTVITVSHNRTESSKVAPMSIGALSDFYIKPEKGVLQVSPCDEHLSYPCDSRPEEIDIAIAAERLFQTTGISTQRINYAWAGLRTFSHDRTPVIGFSNQITGFFWLAGQGGTGIQTAPASGWLTASLILGHGIPKELRDQGVTEESISPKRFEVI
ncbi:NAD(P)/FAD-dependent oxidoreductase [Kistimonas asteriae]|uniref:NAD(P)/FAD-dependent oxidoreductase n=1 Tax=Kistimonas asteriae TaxID=517724 RepID=UPI001BA79DDA|nr:FAD-binding oxidoreductase [Kistimonas asteriae]